MSTLAEEMFNKYAPGGSVDIRKNIAKALDDIKDEMRRGNDECLLLMDWQDLPDDWVAYPETIEYLRNNGFNVEITDDHSSWGREQKVAHVTWQKQKDEN